MKEIGMSVLVVFLLLAGFFTLDYSGLMWESFIGPKRENIRRNIYEQTESYNEGKKEQLLKYYFEYKQAEKQNDVESKMGICATVRQSFANYDTSKLPLAEREFIKDCGGF